MSQYVVISPGGAWKSEGSQKHEGCDICHNERLSPYSDEHAAGIPGAFCPCSAGQERQWCDFSLLWKVLETLLQFASVLAVERKYSDIKEAYIALY
jgi:hypothetical protein